MDEEQELTPEELFERQEYFRQWLAAARLDYLEARQPSDIDEYLNQHPLAEFKENE